jgi:hypothetical protein
MRAGQTNKTTLDADGAADASAWATRERCQTQETESVEGPAARQLASKNRHGTIAPETDTSDRHSHRRKQAFSLMRQELNEA